MLFHQRRFVAYPCGAPGLLTLNASSSLFSSSCRYTLVTTDRCVALLSYDATGYSLQKLEVDALSTEEVNVIASAVVERPDTCPSQVAVAYAVGEALYVQVLIPYKESVDHAEPLGGGEFKLQTAPTCMYSIQASGTNGDVFYGVIVCCTDSMLAIGYIRNQMKAGSRVSVESDAVCTLLDNDQFAEFFPEFATFTHTIMAVDILTSPETDQGWIVFGCADGLVRVYHGQKLGRCLCGPFKVKDIQLNGPVTSVALFLKRSAMGETTSSTWHCNLLVTCAIGQALVYEDLFGAFDRIGNGEVLMDSDAFDSIFAGITADIDLDGEVEFLLGTDSQVMLAYKEKGDDDNSSCKAMESSIELSVDETLPVNEDAPSLSPKSSQNIWDDLEMIPVADTFVASSPEPVLVQRKWQRLSRSHWDMETFGAIYSLLWRDVNHDGVPELLVASSTGIYVYEADPEFVIKKLECVLSALQGSPVNTNK
uniref:Kaptin n=1 Tax=Peronospora matthiolae TaxID=2874970 RepID=A0AAV1UU54_9STRA